MQRRASGADAEARTREALQFALQRGSRSGRVAWQFAEHRAGARRRLKRKLNGAERERASSRVAAAVILRADGTVLLAQRPPGKAYAGYWEFPGGKLEPGESPRACARARARTRSSASSCARAAPWLVAGIRLSARARRARLLPRLRVGRRAAGHDGQAFAWQTPRRFTVAPLLPANTRVLAALDAAARLRHHVRRPTSAMRRVPRARAARARGGLRLDPAARDRTWPLARATRSPAASRAGRAARLRRCSQRRAPTTRDGSGCAGVHWTAQRLSAAHARADRPAWSAHRVTRARRARARVRARCRLRRAGPGARDADASRCATPLGWAGSRRRSPARACRSTRSADSHAADLAHRDHAWRARHRDAPARLADCLTSTRASGRDGSPDSGDSVVFDAIALARPRAEVDRLATLGAERAPFRFGRPRDGCAALRAFDDRGCGGHLLRGQRRQRTGRAPSSARQLA